MPSSNLDRATRRARQRIDAVDGPLRQQMADLYAGVVRNLSYDLDRVTSMIAEAQANGETVNPDWLRRQDRYIRLMWQAEREYERFAGEGMRLIEYGRVRAIRGGAAEAWELLEASGIEATFGANINTAAVENALAATTRAPLQASLAQYGTDGAQTIRSGLLDGMARGLSPRQMVRNIERQLTGPYNRARLDTLVRTESMRGFRAGLNETYASMAHLIAGYRWVAAKSSRTCLACLGMDGRVQSKPWNRFHPCCRCLSSPIPRGVTLPAYESGEDWLRRQSPAVQRRMMPSEDAYTAWAEGKVGLREFVGVRHDRTWGASVQQKSGRQALEGVR